MRNGAKESVHLIHGQMLQVLIVILYFIEKGLGHFVKDLVVNLALKMSISRCLWALFVIGMMFQLAKLDVNGSRMTYILWPKILRELCSRT